MRIEAILDKALVGAEVSAHEGAELFAAGGESLARLVSVADELRRRVAGDRIGYVVNRNINFTNVCVKRCRVCAFSRGSSGIQPGGRGSSGSRPVEQRALRFLSRIDRVP